MDLESHTGNLLCDDHHRSVRERKNKKKQCKEIWVNVNNEAQKPHMFLPREISRVHAIIKDVNPGDLAEA